MSNPAPDLLKDNLTLMFQGKIIVCGTWPYLSGCKLTCRGYKLLLANGVTARVFQGRVLELRNGDRFALIGMTRALRNKLVKAQ